MTSHFTGTKKITCNKLCVCLCSVWLLKRFLHWYYVKRIQRNGNKYIYVFLYELFTL